MRVDLFDFDLPPERIALRPASPRDAARMLVVDGSGMRDLKVRDLPGLLRAGDCLVFNDTRVIPAQLEGRRGEAKIGVTLHKRLGPRDWQVFVRNAKRVRPGDLIDFAADVQARAGERDEDGGMTLSFLGDEPLELLLERAGRMPLPPYIASKRETDARDRDDYQTMFADEPGAVAAPTAALHFTPYLLAALEQAGIQHALLTLHVGAGTFLPVKADDTQDHRMHAEWGRIEPETADRHPRRRRSSHRGRHDQPAPARKRDRRRRHHPAFRRRDAHLHHARLSLPCGRWPHDQLPPAPLDALHARQCPDGHRAHAGRLCARDRRGLSVLQLWGFFAAPAGTLIFLNDRDRSHLH
jgi:S-adenosylmethionine:tRNA ribosyltransferase-isomerase